MLPLLPLPRSIILTSEHALCALCLLGRRGQLGLVTWRLFAAILRRHLLFKTTMVIFRRVDWLTEQRKDIPNTAGTPRLAI